MSYFNFLEDKPSLEDYGCWADIVGAQHNVIGYTNFGNLLLADPSTDEVSLLYVMPFDIDATDFKANEDLPHLFQEEIFRVQFLNESKSDLLLEMLGPLETGEVYIPAPYPMLGGDLSPESYSKGKLREMLVILSELQR